VLRTDEQKIFYSKRVKDVETIFARQSSSLFEIALVLVRFDHVTSIIVNAMISTRLRSRKRKKRARASRPRSVMNQFYSLFIELSSHEAARYDS
jgi:hypothetical protein